MLAKDCLAEFKVECDLRRLSSRTAKGYYNNTALFLTYLEKHLEVTELEEIRTPHIKKYLQIHFFEMACRCGARGLYSVTKVCNRTPSTRIT